MASVTRTPAKRTTSSAVRFRSSTFTSASPAVRCCAKSRAFWSATCRAAVLFVRSRGVPPFAYEPTFACDLSYMGTYAPDRQPKLEELLCARQRTTHGSESSLSPDHSIRRRYAGRTMCEHIPHLSPLWHPEFYSSSRFTLNVTRRDMSIAGYSPSVRLFEAAACGAAIISDNWPGLDDFFVPGKEILLPTGTDDVVRYLTGMSDRKFAGSAKVRRLGSWLSIRARVVRLESSKRAVARHRCAPIHNM